MAQEAFLINPPRRLRRRVKARGRKRRRNPIGETLVTIGSNPFGVRGKSMHRNPENPWYGDSAGHRIAALMRWGKIPRGRVNRHRKRKRGRAVSRVYRKRVVHRKRGRWAPKHIRVRRKIAQQAFWTSKYGYMLSHPRSRKVFTRKGFMTMARHKRTRHRRRNTWFGQPRRHRRAARKGWRGGHMLFATGRRSGRRHRVRHRNYFTNPMIAGATNPRRRRRHNVSHRRRSRRGYRRNPAFGMATFGQFTSGIMNVREWAPLAVTGGLSAITGAIAPSMIGVDNPWAKLGVQTAVAIGGGIVVERFVDKRHGQAWMIVGVAMVGYQLLKQFVFMPYFPQFAVGLGQYQDYYPDSPYIDRDQVSQQVGAFPQAMSAYPGVGDDSVGAYPYDGAGY